MPIRPLISLLLCTVSILLALPLNAQQRTEYVIAPSGLRLRASPNAGAAVVGKLANGAACIPLAEKAIGQHTLFTVPNQGQYFYNDYNYDTFDGQGVRPIYTEWLKVRSGDLEGYAATAYLYPSRPRPVPNEIIYVDSLLELSTVPTNTKDFSWYALRLRDGQPTLIKEEVEFLRYNGEIDLSIEIIPHGGLPFSGIIGSRRPLREGPLQTSFFSSDYTPQHQFTKLDELPIDYDAFFSGPNAGKAEHTYRCTDPTSKAEVTFRLTDGGATPRTIRLIADIDQDGLLDYVLLSAAYGDMSTQVAIYLGTDEKDGVLQPSFSYIVYQGC